MLDFLGHCWPLIPGLIAFIGLLVFGSLEWKNIDREKAAKSDSFFVRNYLYRSPPPEILTEEGLKFYRWSWACMAVFFASILLAIVISRL